MNIFLFKIVIFVV